jgi:hypothetical protein
MGGARLTGRLLRAILSRSNIGIVDICFLKTLRAKRASSELGRNSYNDIATLGYSRQEKE